MSIPYNPIVNELEIAEAISGESHLVGIVGTATYVPSTIRLIQVPEGPFPAVVIPGFSEVVAYSGTNQFIVDYTTGVVVFSSDVANGTSVAASYNGLGSEFAAEDINELQDPLSAIATQMITYNWPSAPTVSYVLNPTTLTSSHIFVGNASNVATDTVLSGDATISNTGVLTISNGVVTGTKIASSTITQSNIVAGTITNTSINASAAIAYSKLALTGDILATDIASGQVVKSVNSLMDAITLAAGSGITITPSGNTLTFASTGSGVASITGTANEVIASASTGAITLSLPQAIATSSSPTFGGISITGSAAIGGSANASAVLTLLSTTQGFLPPAMTTVERNAITSPANGLEIYNTDTVELEYWNGVSWSPVGAGGGVTSITGTANQIIASASVGAITLSTPQDIAAASSPTFANLTIGPVGGNLTFTDNGHIILSSGGSNEITIRVSPALATNFNFTLPVALAGSNAALYDMGGGNLAFTQTPTYTSQTLTAISSQLTLGTTHTTTLSATAPTASLTYTIPDAGASANVVLDKGNYTIGGTWEFSNPLSIGGVADPSAVLTLVSTTQGFRPPVMTSTQRIAISSPATALIVYDSTSNQWMGWNGSSWAILG